MDELDFDPDSFVFSEFPWIVAFQECAEDALAGKPCFLTGKTEEGYSLVPLFSDRDLAERFIDLAGMKDHTVAVQFPSLGQLVLFLRASPAHGFTHVVLDPTKQEGSERGCTLDALREAIEDGIGGREEE
jgi:hypothetical protein